MNRGAVVWVSLGPPSTTGAQAGDRPAIVWVDHNDVDRVLVVPLTSKDKAATIPFVVRIAPDDVNGLPYPSYALTYHIQPARRRLIRRVSGSLSPTDLDRVNDALEKMLFR
jgi:mRNA-degrading endonuclease toxin of MazEF toxin-antitoxin module